MSGCANLSDVMGHPTWCPQDAYAPITPNASACGLERPMGRRQQLHRNPRRKNPRGRGVFAFPPTTDADQKRSRSITLAQAATKSLTNFFGVVLCVNLGQRP